MSTPGCTSVTCRPPARSRSWRRPRRGGRRVTAEVTPHHLLLTDECAVGYDPVFKVNPPLRTGADVEALRDALAVRGDRHRGDRPRAARQPGQGNRVGQRQARHARSADGAVGGGRRPWCGTGLLDWRGVARVMSENPARIGGLADQGRPIAVGEPANLMLLDPAATWTVRGAGLASLLGQHAVRGRDIAGRGVAGRSCAADATVGCDGRAVEGWGLTWTGCCSPCWLIVVVRPGHRGRLFGAGATGLSRQDRRLGLCRDSFRARGSRRRLGPNR